MSRTSRPSRSAAQGPRISASAFAAGTAVRRSRAQTSPRTRGRESRRAPRGWSAGADRVGEAWISGPGPRASHDVEHPTEISRPARDQEGVRERREGIGAVCCLHDTQRRQRVQQDAGAALVRRHARCDGADLVLAFGEPVEDAKLHRCLQDRSDLQPLDHLHQGLWRDRRSLHCGLCLSLHHAPLSFVPPKRLPQARTSRTSSRRPLTLAVLGTSAVAATAAAGPTDAEHRLLGPRSPVAHARRVLLVT